ncbi:MAG: hypothetical protein AVDCRST_MAG66-4340, partial [uncultured Pseudonocardia sp.]
DVPRRGAAPRRHRRARQRARPRGRGGLRRVRVHRPHPAGDRHLPGDRGRDRRV